MDRLKNMGNSVRARVPGQESKPSYSGYADSKSSSTAAKKDEGTLGRIKGYVPAKVTGIVNRATGTPENQNVPLPRSALRDPSVFAPPPKHRAVYGDEAASASIGASTRRPPPPPPDSSSTTGMPSLPQRISTAEDSESRRAPPIPPRLPPRTESFPEGTNVTQEDVTSRGGLTASATSALGRLGKSGVKVPGFETTTVPPPASRPKIGSTGNLFSTNSKAAVTGTSFEDKKAAIKTANAMYKDPTKVSFSDARAAASTARNFQQRHGEQVTEGARVASKYGLIGNGGTPQESSTRASPPLPLRTRYEPPPHESRPALPTKKKPPPPLPPKKKPPPPTLSATRSPPPPPPVPVASRPPTVPLYSRPSPTPSPVSSYSLPNSGYPLHLLPDIPTDLELCLHTEWFTTNPLRLPPSIQNNPNKSTRYSSSWTRSASGRTKHTLILSLLWTINLSSTKIKLTWDASAPASTVSASQRHFPPPTPLSSSELQRMASKGAEIIAWCEARMGTQVGDGECWTLAFQALRATPGVMESQQTSHGACILSHYTPTPPVESGVDIMAGDVLQFWNAKWTYERGGWRKAGDPDHTAVVIGSHRELNGSWVCQVLEQNVGGVKNVVRGEYCIGKNSGMQEGAVRVFRPVWDDWADLDTNWSE
ncbi:hypothetical protein BDD12DRAFT_885255 [Trichophaea hybrida]|nr:hypothetical protein BDD12DRAFT_885255 [Trichophaea hybrida]